eukprot:1450947-Amphidinium_carterae.1
MASNKPQKVSCLKKRGHMTAMFQISSGQPPGFRYDPVKLLAISRKSLRNTSCLSSTGVSKL